MYTLSVACSPGWICGYRPEPTTQRRPAASKFMWIGLLSCGLGGEEADLESGRRLKRRKLGADVLIRNLGQPALRGSARVVL